MVREIIAQELKDKGWQKRFIGVGRRLFEMVEYYKELGFEVCLVPVDINALPNEACSECFLVQSDLFQEIYTRKRSS